MATTNKLILRKKDYRSLGQSREIQQADAASVVEVDLSFNALDSLQQLEKFTALKILILDHNNFSSLRTLPTAQNLDTLSLAYNTLRDMDELLVHCSTCYPQLKHLNLIKNPLNPMFSGMAAKYEDFRAKFKIWLPSLVTLDGIDFKKDEIKIQEMKAEVERQKQQTLSRNRPLDSIPEEAKGQTPSGTGGQSAAAAQNKAGGGAQRSYQFNQRAYKKYHSTKSLVERILKSHSEGNRFIRNEDL